VNHLRILLVDDEQPARSKLRKYLEAEATDSGSMILLEARDGPDAVAQIETNRPDLVFLDIQTPGMNGFEVIEKIGVEKMPAVVFVTAYDEYAIDAFDVQAVDYLLKPFDAERFQKSFTRALKQIELKQPHENLLQNLLNEIKKEKAYIERILVNEGPRYFYVPCNQIVFISVTEKYLTLHTEKDEFLVRETLQNMEQQLDPARFKRIHRSHIINLDYLKEMQPWSHGDYVVLLKTGHKLTLSRRYRDNLFGK
jgi:two-component system LytT family response regulator